MNIGRMILAPSALLLLASAVAVSCAPSPKNVPCTNGGECQKIDPKYAYCLEARCVECVGDASCPDKSVCKDGSCRASCTADKDCPYDGKCSGGFCEN